MSQSNEPYKLPERVFWPNYLFNKMVSAEHLGDIDGARGWRDKLAEEWGWHVKHDKLPEGKQKR